MAISSACQLAVSLASDPELMVLDEPFNGLDPVAVTVLEEVLRQRVRDGSGVLFSSHQLDLVERLCDDVVVIVGGVVRASGSVADIRRTAGHHHLTIETAEPDARLGDVAIGRVVRSSAQSVTVEIDGDGELEAALTRARSVGTVARFDYDLPTLEEAFAAIAGAASHTPGTMVQQ